MSFFVVVVYKFKPVLILVFGISCCMCSRKDLPFASVTSRTEDHLSMSDSLWGSFHSISTTFDHCSPNIQV